MNVNRHKDSEKKMDIHVQCGRHVNATEDGFVLSHYNMFCSRKLLLNGRETPSSIFSYYNNTKQLS